MLYNSSLPWFCCFLGGKDQHPDCFIVLEELIPSPEKKTITPTLRPFSKTKERHIIRHPRLSIRNPPHRGPISDPNPNAIFRKAYPCAVPPPSPNRPGCLFSSASTVTEISTVFGVCMQQRQIPRRTRSMQNTTLLITVSCVIW